MSSHAKPDGRPDVVDVIDRTALIENILNQVIVGYCRPRKEAWEFMWSVALDTSVISLGAKIKVAMGASEEMRLKLDKNALHSVIALRNAFAHHATSTHPVFAVPANEDEQSTSYNQLWVLESTGKITRRKREDALSTFNKDYAKAKESLVALNNAIRARYGNDAA